jgi:hypothetical protein
MSLPRRLIPGRVFATSRRTVDRALLLTPTPQVTKIVGYGLGRALSLTPSVKVLAYFTNTTHPHGLFLPAGHPDGPSEASELERPSGLPQVLGVAHSLIARALNTHYGRGGALWDDRACSCVEVIGPETIEEQLLHVWTQPVKDGLVSDPYRWPGFKIMPEDLGRQITIPRPKGAFFGGRRPGNVLPTDPDALADVMSWLAREERESRALERQRRREELKKKGGRLTKREKKLEARREDKRVREQQRRDLAPEGKPRRDRSRLPEFVTFEVGVPPGYESWPIEKVRAHFRRLLDERVRSIQREFAAAGRPFKGLDRVLAEDPNRSAGPTLPTFGLNPRVACKDKDTRIDALRSLHTWRTAMRDTYLAWRDGERDVVFPRGAYGIWHDHGALVAGGHVPAARDSA